MTVNSRKKQQPHKPVTRLKTVKTCKGNTNWSYYLWEWSGFGDSRIGKKFVVEYGILIIFRRNEGILHPCRGRIFSKMIHWIRNFDKVLWTCGILHLLSCKKEVVASWFLQSAESILRITGHGSLVKNHRSGRFQLKIVRKGGFLPPWWPPLIWRESNKLVNFKALQVNSAVANYNARQC